jgi:hypothetical protein
MKITTTTVIIAAAFLLQAILADRCAAHFTPRPNIVLIMADDK